MATQDFTPEADATVADCVEAFRAKLVEEAREVEELQNPSGTNRQVTPAHVGDANLRLRKYYLAPKTNTPTAVYIFAMITVVCSFVGGLASNNWNKGWGQALFITMLIFGMMSAVAAINKERK